MAGTVRIEKCQTQAAATTRKAALDALQFQSVICPGGANVVIATASADGTTTTDDSFQSVNAAFVVIAIRST